MEGWKWGMRDADFQSDISHSPFPLFHPSALPSFHANAKTKKHSKKELYYLPPYVTSDLTMKNTFSFCILLSLFAAAAIPSSYGQDNSAAQSSPGSSAVLQSPAKKRQVSPEARKRRQLSLLKKEAGLMADQESKVIPIISKYVDDVIALKNDTSLVGAARREKRKTLHSQYVSDINAVLTPDQQKNWAAANAARIERLRAGRQAAQPNASPSDNE
jgi:hypothetical protein